MSAEDIKAINAKREAAYEFVRKHVKGSGGVGFGDIDPEPLVSDTIEVVSNPIKIQTKEEVKTVVRKSRIVLLSNGEVDVIGGGLNAPISEKDAKKIFDQNLKTRLKNSLHPQKVTKKLHEG